MKTLLITDMDYIILQAYNHELSYFFIYPVINGFYGVDVRFRINNLKFTEL